MCIGCSGVARNCVTAIAQPPALLCRQTYPLEIASLSTQKALTSTAGFSHHYSYPTRNNCYYPTELLSSNLIVPPMVAHHIYNRTFWLTKHNSKMTIDHIYKVSGLFSESQPSAGRLIFLSWASDIFDISDISYIFDISDNPDISEPGIWYFWYFWYFLYFRYFW